MQMSRQNVLLAASLLSVSASLCSAKCFKFLGFSSCMSQIHDLEEEFPFTSEWFFVNFFKRANMIKMVKRRFFEVRLVEMSVNFNRPLREAKDIIELDEFWKTVGQVVDYIEGARGDPVELLYDERVNPVDLLRSFRSHNEEIVNFVRAADEGGAFTEDIRGEIERLCNLLRAAGKALNNLPEFTDSAFFKMIEQSAYRDPKIAALAPFVEQAIPTTPK